MTANEIQKIREVVRQELLGTGVSAEFRELVAVEYGDSVGDPIDHDFERPDAYCQDTDTDNFEKLFGTQELKKRQVVRSRMAPAAEQDQTVEEFFGCEKASRPGMVRLTKRLIETGEIMIEAWNSEGRCTSTRFVSASELDEGEPLTKSAITSAMYKTLNSLRASMTPEEIKLAEKAIAALDTPCFLEIILRAQTVAA